MIESVAPKFSKKPIKVIGCGLAGAEVALILANNGFDVHIFDNGKNRPKTPFGYYDRFQNFMIENMRFELDCLNSPLFFIAKKYGFQNFGFEYDENFMMAVRKELESNVKIKIFNASIENINNTETTIVATGHNTDATLLSDLENYIGKMHLCFYQPEKMVIDARSVNLDNLNFVSDFECYANLSEAEYRAFHNKTIEFDEKYDKLENLEKERQITIESVARRSGEALRNSILRPHFDENNKCYASLKMKYVPHFKILVVEDFCSGLDEEEQSEIVRTIPALENCKILKFSKVMRKTFLLSPTCINNHMQIDEKIYVCGGLAGTAGSFESLLVANYCAYCLVCDRLGSSACDLLLDNTCIGKIVKSLLEKSVVKFRLFNLKYDIMNDEDLEKFRREEQIQKILSKSQVEKFKEKLYGKYF